MQVDCSWQGWWECWVSASSLTGPVHSTSTTTTQPVLGAAPSCDSCTGKEGADASGSSCPWLPLLDLAFSQLNPLLDLAFSQLNPLLDLAFSQQLQLWWWSTESFCHTRDGGQPAGSISLRPCSHTEWDAAVAVIKDSDLGQ